MTGLAYDPLFPGLPSSLDGPLVPKQAARLSGILVSVGLSASQAEQIIRRMNESTPEPDPKGTA